MRPGIFTVNENKQALNTGDTIFLGNTVKRSGCDCVLQGNSILINTQNDYTIIASVTGAATADGAISVAAYKDGVALPGASAATTVEAGQQATLAIVGLSKKNCCCCCFDDTASISFVWTGAAGTVSNIAVKVTNE